MTMRVLVCTVVHHPTDARIFSRQIGAMLQAGMDVSAIAPWPADIASTERYRKYPIPRAVGLHRVAALRAARARVRALASDHAVLIIHDPELLIALPWGDLRRAGTRVVWDVHEDLAAALAMKPYLPRLVRAVLGPAVRFMERWAERRVTLLLAESAYQERFRRIHPVVLNLPPVPVIQPREPRERRAIYVGSITRARGLDVMLGMATALAPHGIRLRLVGEAPNPEDAARIRAATNVDWDGPLPNEEALREIEQSRVGLALLADQPNYRHSMPTKILEYMACGTPVVATPLPLSRLVVGSDGVVLEGFDLSADEIAREIIDLCDDEARWQRCADSAYVRVRDHYNWEHAKTEFLATLR